MKKWLLLGAAIVTEVTGSMSLKAAQEQPWWYALVVVGYSAAFWFMFQAMKAGLGLGVAYGIWAALGVAITAILAAVIFGEAVTGLMAVGIVLVMGGVLMIELGSQRALRLRAQSPDQAEEV